MRTRKSNSTGNRLLMLLVGLFLYAPIIILIIFSFNEGNSSSVWKGFSLHWYAELLNDRLIMHSVYITLLVSLLATIIATVGGTFAAIGFYGMRRKSRNALTAVNNIPMMNADIVTGVGLCLLFVGIPITRDGVIRMTHVAFLTDPEDSFIVDGILLQIREGILGGSLGRTKGAPQGECGLESVHFSARSELGGSDTGVNAVFHSPQNGIVIIIRFADIGEGVHVENWLGGAEVVPQGIEEHASGQDLIGSEHALAGIGRKLNSFTVFF